MNIRANDPSRKSWVQVENGSDFPIQNLPFGIFSTEGSSKKVGVALGSKIIDVAAVAEKGHFNTLNISSAVFTSEFLNDFMSIGKENIREVRNILSDLFEESNDTLKGASDVLADMSAVTMHMPVKIGDYTDFYASREHATNVGTMFRDPNNALLPNWLHLPVGYHGRASSIIPSGQDIIRPKGQRKLVQDEPPTFGESVRLDFELEMAFLTLQGKPLGHSISTSEAEDYIFGLCLFNDWSARDLQQWEYVPLGPFLGKNFASSVSPWIVTLDALTPFKVNGPEQDPKPLPYLQFEGNMNYDINLETIIQPENGNENVVCRSNFKYMYWNMAQQLAHHTVNGCNINTGDMLASGTISGSTTDSYGSMLEIAWKGTKPIKLDDGTERKFIHDGDSVIMRGYCEKDGVRIGFGEVNSKVLPAI